MSQQKSWQKNIAEQIPTQFNELLLTKHKIWPGMNNERIGKTI